MNLLIVTQKIDKDDENLGAFYSWFEEFAKKCNKVVIIAHSIGNATLPANVEIYSWGKRKEYSSWRRLWKFWGLFSNYYALSDAVLFHQIPEFVIASAPFLLSLKKKSALWYAHKSVTWKLKIAERMVDFIFTSSANGFRLPSKKVHIVGQAINTDLFKPAETNSSPKDILRVVTVGRISPVKDYDTIIRACGILKKEWDKKFSLSIVGGPMRQKDYAYLEALRDMVVEEGLEGIVNFLGSKSYLEIPKILGEHDMFINVSRTGSLDKAVLEAMASGLTVLCANEAYESILPEQYFIKGVSPISLTEHIQLLSDEKRPNERLRSIVVEKHSLEKTLDKMLSLLSR